VLTCVGLHIPSSALSDAVGGEQAGSFERMADIAVTAESSGFDSIWVTDRSGAEISPSARDAPAFEAYTVLGALTARTQTVSLGALVTPVIARNPAVLAKIVTALDVLSGGRAVLGLGMGGVGDEGVTSAVGGTGGAGDDTGQQPPSPVGGHPGPGHERLDRLAEGLGICRAMFTEESPTFEGQYYRVEQADNRPRPVRAGGIPILVGGGEDDDVLELVARYGDAVTIEGNLESVGESLTALDRHCDDVGRDPASISRIGVGTLVIAPTEVEAARRLGRLPGSDKGDPRDPGHRANAVVGSPDAVANQVGELLDVGVDGLVLTMVDAHELELVELAGRTLRSLFR
jgi:alkanesulfonate monooxygenase SsuD/methylene tetrahydromethanopterin reductase-like flavin-dependent oxidoreductase (luciferase family)